jgi:hypothetical protein
MKRCMLFLSQFLLISRKEISFVWNFLADFARLIYFLWGAMTFYQLDVSSTFHFVILSIFILYDNEYAWLSIYTYMNTFIDLKLLELALQNILDALSDVLVKCLRFSLIKIESVSTFQAKPCLVPSSQSVVFTFLLKMLSLVLIKN